MEEYSKKNLRINPIMMSKDTMFITTQIGENGKLKKKCPSSVHEPRNDFRSNQDRKREIPETIIK